MKRLLFVLFIAAIVALQIQTASAEAREGTKKASYPAYLSVGSLSFPLKPRPVNRTVYEGVPYVSDIAFWRINGNALDISSHCTETPGSEFYKLRVGDTAILEYSNRRQETYLVSEIIVVKYKSTSDPFSDAWVAGDVEYTAQEFANFIYSQDIIALHTSLCYYGFSFGQTYYLLTRT